VDEALDLFVNAAYNIPDLPTPLPDAEIARIYHQCLDHVFVRVHANSKKYSRKLMAELQPRFSEILDRAAHRLALIPGLRLMGQGFNSSKGVAKIRENFRTKSSYLLAAVSILVDSDVTEAIDLVKTNLHLGTAPIPKTHAAFRAKGYSMVRAAAAEGTPSDRALKLIQVKIFQFYDADWTEAHWPLVQRGLKCVEDVMYEGMEEGIMELFKSQKSSLGPGGELLLCSADAGEYSLC
jgi:hypothetical protein